MSQKRLETELKVGIFVSIGLVLVMIAILLLGSTENLLSRKSQFTIHINSAEGLIGGAKVMLGGIQIGTVDKVGFDNAQGNVVVTLNVTNENAKHIRKDSEAEIATQGVLGDRFVSITPGTAEAGNLPSGSDIPVLPSKGISQFLSQSDQLVARLTSVATSLDILLKQFNNQARSDKFFAGMAQTSKNLASATEKLDHQMDDLKLKKIIKNLESITDKINSGNGTMGALINDPGLYDNVKALVGQANRNRILRNLVRQTLRDSETKEAKDAEQQQQQKK
jgi:phospholipid/cholesterol/gamma-HCH transport system substrate-binding protein